MKYFLHIEKFTSVSITGSACWLNCRFCRGKYLRHMTHLSRDRAGEILRGLYESGVRGILVSGGFTREGYLPIEGFIDVLRDARRKYGFIYNAHLGLQRDRSTLEALRGIIDVVDYEFTLSNYIAKYVRGLPVNVEAYLESLKLMSDAGLHVVPHLYLWHPGFSKEVFRREVKAVEDLGLNEVTLLVYIPEPGEATTPQAGTVLENLREARRLFNGKMYLGCMRPHYIKRELDTAAVDEGLVDRIANPYHPLLDDSSEIYDACCSLPENLLQGFKTSIGRR